MHTAGVIGSVLLALSLFILGIKSERACADRTWRAILLFGAGLSVAAVVIGLMW